MSLHGVFSSRLALLLRPLRTARVRWNHLPQPLRAFTSSMFFQLILIIIIINELSVPKMLGARATF